MRIRIEVCPDRRLRTAAESYVLNRGAAARLLALGPVVVGALLLLFAGARAWIFAVGLIVLGVLEAALLPWLLPRLAGRAVSTGTGLPKSLELHDGGVRSVWEEYDLDRPWSMFERTVELPGQYLLMVNRRNYVSVPTRDLSPDDEAEVRDLLARHARLAASTA